MMFRALLCIIVFGKRTNFIHNLNILFKETKLEASPFSSELNTDNFSVISEFPQTEFSTMRRRGSSGSDDTGYKSIRSCNAGSRTPLRPNMSGK